MVRAGLTDHLRQVLMTTQNGGTRMDYLDTRIKELTTEQDEHLLRSSQPYGWPGLWRKCWEAGLVGACARL